MSEKHNDIKGQIKKYYDAMLGEQELPSNIDTIIDMLIDRVELYLRRADLNIRLASPLANILMENTKAQEANDAGVIDSIQDASGQKVSFKTDFVQSLASETDQKLFGSHISILNRYRRIGVLGVDPFADKKE